MNSPDIQLFGRQAPIATVNQATIGLPRPLEPILQWAQRLGLAKILVAVLDASKTDRHLDYLGTIVEYLSDQETAKLIQTWSDELPCAADLSELCDACVISPFISRTYPPMPALKQVARQLTGGLLTKLATVAMVARPVPAAAAGDG